MHTYDRTGNILSGGVGAVIRRIDELGDPPARAVVAVPHVAGSTEEYYQNEANQVLEMRIGTVASGVKTVNSNPRERTLWDITYIDAPAMIELDTNTDGTRDNRLWPTWDQSHNVTAFLTDAGKIVQHMVYTPFGSQIILNGASNYAGTGADPDGSEWTVDTNGSDFLYGGSGFQGLRYDPESGNWYARARYESPAQGNWTQRDPDDYIDGASLCQLLESNPITNVDPFGLYSNVFSDYLGDIGKRVTSQLDDYFGTKLNKYRGDILAAIQLSDVPPCDGLHGTIFKDVVIPITTTVKSAVTVNYLVHHYVYGFNVLDTTQHLFDVVFSGIVSFNVHLHAEYVCCDCEASTQPSSKKSFLKKVTITDIDAQAKIRLRLANIAPFFPKEWGKRADDLSLVTGGLNALKGSVILDLPNPCGDKK